MRKIRNPAAEKPLPGFEVFHEEFLTSRKEELVDLVSALSRGEFKVLQDMGHKWKGFCNPYGFQELGELAIKMEVASEQKNADLCSELLEQISAYLGAN